MASKIQQIVVTNDTPASDEMGLVVRPIGGTGGGNVTIVDPIGQKPMADSVSVVIASDQTPVPVSGSFSPVGTQDINLIEVGGVATSLGQKVSASSIPVVLPSDQIVPVSSVDFDVRNLVFATDKVDVSGSVISAAVSNFPATQPVSVANGADVAEGNTADTPWNGIAANATIIALLKALFAGSGVHLTQVDQGLGLIPPGPGIIPWIVTLTDSTTGVRQTVRITAAVSGDAAAVVALSPDTPLPAGTNQLGFVKTDDTQPNGVASHADSLVEQASLASIDGKLNSLGQKPMATSVPVVVASDQSDINTFITGGDVTVNGAITAFQPVNTAYKVEVTGSGGVGSVGITEPSTPVSVNDRAFVVAISPNSPVEASALVSDARESYISGDIKPLSLTSDGRLRVSASPSDMFLDFFGGLNPYGNANEFGMPEDLYQQPNPLGRE